MSVDTTDALGLAAMLYIGVTLTQRNPQLMRSLARSFAEHGRTAQEAHHGDHDLLGGVASSKPQSQASQDRERQHQHAEQDCRALSADLMATHEPICQDWKVWRKGINQRLQIDPLRLAIGRWCIRSGYWFFGHPVPPGLGLAMAESCPVPKGRAS